MRAVGNVVVISCAVLGSGISCSSHKAAPPEAQAEAEGALVARSAVCTLSLPFGSDASRFVVGANGALQLGDRVHVSAPIENAGSGGTQIGVEAQVGDVHSVSQIALRDRTMVTGAVFTTVPLSTTPASRVLGPVNTHAVLTPPSTQSIPANFPAAGDVDILLEPGQAAQPAPGRYRNAQVKSRATLTLRTGTYFFESFGVIEPQARVVLDERLGPVILFVAQPITFRGVVQSNLAQPDWLIAVIGSGTVTIESSFQGTILAPLAALNLGTGGLTHTGAFFAHDVLAQPDTRLVQHTSSALSRCATVLGGKRSHELTARERDIFFDPVNASPWPGTFQHGVSHCVNTKLEEVAQRDPADVGTFQLVPNPSCAEPMLFCDANTGRVVSPQPTLAELNAAPPAGSICRAQPAADRCLCPINPATLGAACNFSSDCPNGTVCATICSGPNCSVPRRCGSYEGGCDGLPELANCQDLEICPDPQSTGEFKVADLVAKLKPANTPPTPGNTPQPPAPPIEHFDPPTALIAAAKNGDACGLEPVPVALPVVDQSAANGAPSGKDSWGVNFTPRLSQQTTSTTLEPFGVVLPKFNAAAGLDIVATVFGQDVSVLQANAVLGVDLCHAKAAATVSVGPFGDDVAGPSFETGVEAEQACVAAENFLERATSIMNWAEGQVLAVIDQYQTQGPDVVLCQQMAKEFPDIASSLNCTGDPTAAARLIVDRLTRQYREMATDAIHRAAEYADRLAAIRPQFAGDGNGNVPLFDDQLEVVGAEADFPIGPFVVTVGGSVSAHLNVTARPGIDLETHPGRPLKIGGTFTVTPSATVDATAIVGVGFVVVTVGLEGQVHLIGIDVPVTAEVGVTGRSADPDPRVPASDGYGAGATALSDQPGFGGLRSLRYSWDPFWSLTGNLHIDSFLSGTINGFVRIKFLFFSKTFRRRIVSWAGIDPESVGIPRDISLFDLHSPAPAPGPAPVRTAPRFAYVSPPQGSAITIADPPPPPPPPPPPKTDGGIILVPLPTSPVQVKNLTGLVQAPVELCNAQPPPK